VKASDYRKQVEKELSAKPAAKAAPRFRASLTGGGQGAVEARREAVRSAVSKASDLPTAIPALLKTLADPAQPEPVRGSALASLKAASFVATAFKAHRAEFIRTLRGVLKDSGPELRERALEVLAIEKDPEAQELLVKGLKDPSVALVPPATALQFLSYDDHGSFAPTVRKIVAESQDEQVRQEGLRLLATDPKSEKLFQGLLADKEEMSGVRRLSAVALQQMNPAKFERVARAIVDDDSDFDEIRATSLSALTHVRDYAKSRSDAALVAKADELKSGKSGALKSAAAKFLKRIG
jgi:HEAT repeat protein